jgi:hypothetical protein
MSLNDPFHWAQHPRPSIFVGASGFPPAGKLTSSQISTKSVEAQQARTGRNPGTIRGLVRTTEDERIRFVANKRKR